MSQKNILPVVVAVVAILAIGGGAAYFAMNDNMANEAAPAQSTTAADTEAAAGSEQAAASGDTEQSSASAEEERAAEAATGGIIGGVQVKPGNPVVATVDGKDVTRVDVYRYIQMMPANIQQLPASAVYPLALEQVINTRLVQNKAEAAGLENDPEVQQQLDMARQQIIRSVYVQRQVDKEISDKEIRDAYDDYVAKIPDIQEIRASHILVDSREKAEQLIAELKNGADFSTLAAQNSNDPGNKDRGGDLGFFAPQDMVKEFSDAAFKMDVGTISETPVKTQFGWHVVKVTDKRARPKPSFQELKPMIQVELRRQTLEGMLEDWKETANIEKFDINGDPLKEGAPQAAAETAPEAAPSDDKAASEVAPATGE